MRSRDKADGWQGLPSWSQFLDYKWEMAALALCTSVNIGCNNASLVWLSLFVNQILKANAPLMTMVTSFLILRRTYAWKIIVCVLFIAVGAAFAVPFGSGNVTVVGIVLVIIATLASSTKVTTSRRPRLASPRPFAAPSSPRSFPRVARPPLFSSLGSGSDSGHP